MYRIFFLSVALVFCLANVAQNLIPMPRYYEPRSGKNTIGLITHCSVSPETLPSTSPEAYCLRITADSIIIYAAAPEGFMRGEQTLVQLRTEQGAYPCVDIADAPAYQWRGAMIDVSRHFFPIGFLRKQIDYLARYKFNRLHLHLTDAAGWRIEIKRYPRLTSLAAWRKGENWKAWWNENGRQYCEEGTPDAYGGYYTQDDLRQLVAYAAQRGITIVPEIEMPAHSEEVLTAYPELSCTHEPYRQADFCPGSVATYDFLEHVLDEVIDIFPSEDIHVGGDEAGMGSWPTCPLCQQKMKELGITQPKGLQSHLIARMGQYLKSKGRRLVGWDEVIDSGLADGTTVMVWRSADFAADAVRSGYDVVLSPGSHCYLDAYQDNPPSQPEAMGGFLPLEKIYSFVPGEGLTEAERRQHIRGVQANLWTEYIPTEAQVEYMLYPRLLALAEVGWNGTETKDYAAFRKRALAETEWLRGQGVNAFDLRHEVGNRKAYDTTVKHKAIGARVTYNVSYNNAYRAAGDASLTDGKRGGWSYGNGRWQGFIDKGRLDVTIDLGERKRFGRVSADFFQSCGPEIFYPATFSVSVSDDGEHFVPLGSDDREVERTIQPGIVTRSVKARAAARYIRVQADAGKFGGWVFTDEIVVK